MKHWKLTVLIAVTLATYIVLMSVRDGLPTPALRTAAGVVAAISIGVSLIAALRLGRRLGGRAGR